MDTSAGIHTMFGFYKTCTIGMPSLCAGMPLITTQYALNIKRRETLKSVTHRAYGPYALCVLCTPDDCCLTQTLADLAVGFGPPPADAPPSSIGRVKHAKTGAPGKYWYARATDKLTNDDTIVSPGRVCRKMPPGSKTRYVCGPA